MAVITLRKGSSTGPEQDFTLGFINLDELEEGTHYTIRGQDTVTLTIGGTLKVKQIILEAPGLDYLNIGEATDLLPEMRWSVGATVAQQSGTWTPAESPGTKPADWDLHFCDKYYTQSDYTYDGHTVYTYQHVNAASDWDPDIQYYANGDNAARYWTPNSGVFGVRHLYASAAGARVGIAAALLYNEWCGSGASDNPLAPHLRNLSGQAVGGDNTMNGAATRWSAYIQKYAGGGAVQSDVFKGRIILLEVILGGETYIGAAVVDIDAADSVTGCGFWIGGSKFWISDDIKPGTPGDWGAKSGALNPSGATPTSFAINAGIDLTFPSALNSASYGGTAGGLYTWALTGAQYGAVNSAIWDEKFIDRIMHIGRSPGDGIVQVHAMPDSFTYGSSQSMRMYGIPLYGCTGSLVSSRTYTVDLGYVDVTPDSGYYGDYSAQIELYLPFCGTYSLDVQKVMRSSLHIVYRFDIMTGDCCAMVEASTHYPIGVHEATGTAIILSVQGNAAFSLPYAYTDGGVQGKLSALSGAVTAAMGAASGSSGMMLSGVSGLVNLGREQISHGAVSGNSGALGKLRPVLWIKYPSIIEPANYADTVGYVSAVGGTVGTMIYDNIGDNKAFEGFTVFEAVDVEGIPCTKEEALEIENLLRGGVFL